VGGKEGEIVIHINKHEIPPTLKELGVTSLIFLRKENPRDKVPLQIQSPTSLCWVRHSTSVKSSTQHNTQAWPRQNIDLQIEACISRKVSALFFVFPFVFSTCSLA